MHCPTEVRQQGGNTDEAWLGARHAAVTRCVPCAGTARAPVTPRRNITLLTQDELQLLCHRKLRRPSASLLRARAIRFAGASESRDQSPGDVVCRFVQAKVAHQLRAATARDDAAPVLGIFAKRLFLERVDLIADGSR